MKRSILISASVFVFSATPAESQNWFGNSLVPQTEARDAAQSGRTIPFAKISRDLERRYGGSLIDAALYSDDNGGYHYDVIWMSGDGKRLMIKVNALSGAILHVRGG